MTPQSVGWKDTKIVLGKHSGRHGLDARLRELGYKLSAEQLKAAYRRFVELADRNKHVSDSDLVYIAEINQDTPAPFNPFLSSRRSSVFCTPNIASRRH